ncbi:hypothetical protein PENTCL1PPCAC_3606, partial [Pristionchus entomophagus]
HVSSSLSTMRVLIVLLNILVRASAVDVQLHEWVTGGVRYPECGELHGLAENEEMVCMTTVETMAQCFCDKLTGSYLPSCFTQMDSQE